MPFARDIKGVLLDLDGVLYIGDTLIPGATEAVERLNERNIPRRYLTNTSDKTRREILEKLTRLGLPIEEHEIISAPQACMSYLESMDSPSCHFLLPESLKAEFRRFDYRQSHPAELPDYVVIGDIDEQGIHQQLNEAFNLIMNGASLIAMHKGRYWRDTDGLKLDIGAYIASLEYATGQNAVVIGKPSATFFKAALAGLGLEPSDVVMIGDDILSDVKGAQQCGIDGILVKTGKYNESMVTASGVNPAMIIDSIADLPQHL